MARIERDIIWRNRYFENEAKCPVCEIKIMRKDDSRSWHKGHIIADQRGGPSVLPNIIPICRKCNLIMNNLHIPEYMVKIGKISLDEGIRWLEHIKHEIFEFDPICEGFNKSSGLRCRFRKSNQNSPYCYKHYIEFNVYPMDTLY